MTRGMTVADFETSSRTKSQMLIVQPKWMLTHSGTGWLIYLNQPNNIKKEFDYEEKNKWILLLIICLGGSVIFIFPYLQYTFYDAMMEKFNFNNTQMGSLISVYGALNLVAYSRRLYCRPF